MSAPARRRAVWLWLLAIGGLAAVVVVGGRPSSEEPFDPRSVEPSGTRALVVLLEELGAEVTIGPDIEPVGRDGVVAVLRDDAGLSEGQVAALEAAARDGATVVVTDPYSSLTPALGDPVGAVGPFATDQVLAPGVCTVDALVPVGEVEASASFTFDASGADERCYGDDGQAFVTTERLGEGVVVAVGGTTPFTNAHLGEAGNAALIASLLVPRPGTQVVLVDDDPSVGGTADSPFDLIDPSVRQAFLQLGVAFVVYALARGRRLGRPVREHQPVALEGSELVAAVGDLLHRTGDPARAARRLRDDALRRFRERLGLPPEAAPETVAAAVAARAGVDPERVALILSTKAVTTDDELLSLAHDVESLRQEILHEPAH